MAWLLVLRLPHRGRNSPVGNVAFGWLDHFQKKYWDGYNWRHARITKDSTSVLRPSAQVIWTWGESQDKSDKEPKIDNYQLPRHGVQAPLFIHDAVVVPNPVFPVFLPGVSGWNWFVLGAFQVLAPQAVSYRCLRNVRGCRHLQCLLHACGMGNELEEANTSEWQCCDCSVEYFQ